MDQEHVPASMRVIQVDMKALINNLLMQKGEFLTDYDVMFEACFRLLGDDKKYFDDHYNEYKDKRPGELLDIVDSLDKDGNWECEEWSMPASAKMPHKLKIREHALKCLEYIAYKEVLFESYNDYCMTYGNFDLSCAERFFKAMLTFHAKASQHLAAMYILKNHQYRSYDFRTQQGGLKKSLRLKGRDLDNLYFNMVKHFVLVDPPNVKESVATAADRYTKSLLKLNEEFGFFASEKPDEIFQSVLDVLSRLNFSSLGKHRTYFERIKKKNVLSLTKDGQPVTLSEYGFYKSGVCQGLLLSVEMMVSQAFGEISEEHSDKLKTATYHELLVCLNSLNDAEKVSDVFSHL